LIQVPVDQTKATLREQFRRIRASLEPEYISSSSRRIVERALCLDELAGVHTLHAYWPDIARYEVDARPLIRTLASRGVVVALPVITAADRPSKRMTQHRFRGEDDLEPGTYGLLQPRPTDSIDTGDLDAALVPALGVGRNGHRIGHGAGYYDRFLREVTCPRICLIYDACLVAYVTPEEHDIPVDIIVTEYETIRV
jgi:5-formyltetrahydrofolate cyclo-ligase